MLVSQRRREIAIRLALGAPQIARGAHVSCVTAPGLRPSAS
jgi:hypothetical protein